MLHRMEQAAWPMAQCDGSHLGDLTHMGAQASRPRRSSAGKLPSLPGNM